MSHHSVPSHRRYADLDWKPSITTPSLARLPGVSSKSKPHPTSASPNELTDIFRWIFQTFEMVMPISIFNTPPLRIWLDCRDPPKRRHSEPTTPNSTYSTGIPSISRASDISSNMLSRAVRCKRWRPSSTFSYHTSMPSIRYQAHRLGSTSVTPSLALAPRRTNHFRQSRLYLICGVSSWRDWTFRASYMGFLGMTGPREWGRCTNRSGGIIFTPPRAEDGRQWKRTTTCYRWRPCHLWGRCKGRSLQKLKPPRRVGVSGWPWKIGWWVRERRKVCKVASKYGEDGTHDIGLSSTAIAVWSGMRHLFPCSSPAWLARRNIGDSSASTRHTWVAGCITYQISVVI